MKTLTYLTIAIALGGACRSTKEKEQRRFQESLDQRDHGSHHSFHHWNNMDSSAIYWQYSGDTVFYFHPKSGLWASGGVLHVQGSNSLHRQGYAWRDSSVIKEQIEKRSWTKRVGKMVTQRWRWGILLLSMAVVLGWVVGKGRGKQPISSLNNGKRNSGKKYLGMVFIPLY